MALLVSSVRTTSWSLLPIMLDCADYARDFQVACVVGRLISSRASRRRLSSSCRNFQRRGRAAQSRVSFFAQLPECRDLARAVPRLSCLFAETCAADNVSAFSAVRFKSRNGAAWQTHFLVR